MAKGEKPPQMTMLEAKGIHVRDFFRFRGSPDQCYAVSRSWQFIGLDGEPAALSENEIWERYESVERIDREEYEQAQADYRDKVWRSRGQPDGGQLEEMAPVFLNEYCNHFEAGRWKYFCRFDEETLRRLLDQVIDAMLVEKKVGARERQKKYQEVYRELVLAKANRSARYAPAAGPK